MIPVAKNIKRIIDDKARIGHILDCIDKIEVATKEQTFDSFINDKMLRLAVSKLLEIIGEASIHIKEETKNKYPDIDWQEMIDLSNHILYEYYNIDYSDVWNAVINLKDLKPKIQAIKLDLNSDFLTN